MNSHFKYLLSNETTIFQINLSDPIEITSINSLLEYFDKNCSQSTVAIDKNTVIDQTVRKSKTLKNISIVFEYNEKKIEIKMKIN